MQSDYYLELIVVWIYLGYGYSEPYPNTEYSSHSHLDIVKAVEQEPLRDSSSASSVDVLGPASGGTPGTHLPPTTLGTHEPDPDHDVVHSANNARKRRKKIRVGAPVIKADIFELEDTLPNLPDDYKSNFGLEAFDLTPMGGQTVKRSPNPGSPFSQQLSLSLAGESPGRDKDKGEKGL